MTDRGCLTCGGLSRIAIAGEDCTVPCPYCCPTGIAVAPDGDRFRAIQRRVAGETPRGETRLETCYGYGATADDARRDLREMHAREVRR